MEYNKVFSFIFIAILLLGCSLGENKDRFKFNNETKTREIDSLMKTANPYIGFEDSLQYAIDIYTLSLNKSNDLQYINGIVTSCNNLGYAYTNQSKLAKASGYFYSALKNAELIQDTTQISSSLFGLGLVMYNMNNWDDAILYFTKALAHIQVKKKHALQTSKTQYLLGLCYFELDQREMARKYFLESKKNAVLIEDDQSAHEIRLALNNLVNDVHEREKVLLEYNELYKFFVEKGERVGIAYTLNGMARHYILKEDYSDAVYYSNKSLIEAKKLNIIYPLQSILKTVTQAEFLNENYKLAYFHNMELQQIRDSIQGINAASKVTLMQADYEFDKSKKSFNDKIAAQKKQRRIWTIVAAVMTLIVLSIFYLLKKVSKEQKKSEKLLLNILPLETAKELKKYGKAKAKTHKEVAIVFADIKGFTQISSQLSADVIVEMLDIYFSEFDNIIEEFNLEKIKTIGDAYMFAGGLDNDPRCTVNAVNASLAMLKKIETIGDRMKQKYGINLTFRFGMHIGEVVSGVVGEKKYAFDIWGDAVNVAARMEENSEPGKLNITEQTYLKVEDLYHFEPRGEIEAKNRGKIKMYYLSNLNPNF